MGNGEAVSLNSDVSGCGVRAGAFGGSVRAIMQLAIKADVRNLKIINATLSGNDVTAEIRSSDDFCTGGRSGRGCENGSAHAKHESAINYVSRGVPGSSVIVPPLFKHVCSAESSGVESFGFAPEHEATACPAMPRDRIVNAPMSFTVRDIRCPPVLLPGVTSRSGNSESQVLPTRYKNSGP